MIFHTLIVVIFFTQQNPSKSLKAVLTKDKKKYYIYIYKLDNVTSNQQTT